MPDKDAQGKELAASLARVGSALSRSETEAPPGPAAIAVRAGSAVAGVGLLAVAVATGLWWVALPGVGLVGLAALLGRLRPGRAATGPRIGPGASVATGARVEPGAIVEMGATIGSGALIERGARVRWGASIARGAVVKQGAVIHWGASVGRGATVAEGAVVNWGAHIGHDAVVEANAIVEWGAFVSANAVVGRGAVVGVGSTVEKGARLDPGTRSWPGSSIGRAVSLPLPPSATSDGLPDERARRIDAVCDRLQQELDAAPEVARTFLGSQQDTVKALRATCHDLLRRERLLQGEASHEAITRLEEEAAGMRERIAREPDAKVKVSLSAAMDAIEAQKKERQSLATGVVRLEAEQARMLWTLESISTQLVRLRSADSPTAVQPQLEATVTRLKEEIDAIADALEEVQRPEVVAPVSAAPEGAAVASRERQRG